MAKDILSYGIGALAAFAILAALAFLFISDITQKKHGVLFSGERDEMPFNRATRAWVHTPGALIFVNHPCPVLEEERLPTPALALGEGFCRQPFEARSIVNVSGMSFGAISAPAVRALSRGAALARG